MDSDKYNQILQIARLYYIDQIPQNKIAEQEGLSKAKVNRLIKKAHELDFIKITVEPPKEFSQKLENSLKYLYGLEKIKIINRDQKTPYEIEQLLNQEFLEDVQKLLVSGDVLGISFNNKQYSLLETLAESELIFNQDLKIVEINGSIVSVPKEINSTDFLYKLSEELKAKTYQICSSLYVGEKRSAHLLMQDGIIDSVLNKASQAKAVLLSVEPMDINYLLNNGLTDNDLKRLSRKEPVGMCCGHIINRKGKLIDNVIDQKEIGLNLSDIKSIPNKMVISTDRQEASVIKAMLNTQLIDYLYISDDVADRIN